MQIGTAITKKKLSELREHPLNQRFHTDISGVERTALTESIRELGLLNPIVVTQEGTIVSGHQRWKIAGELGYENISTVQFQGTEQEALYFLVSENKARRDQERDPIKKALQYQVLYDHWGIQHGGSRSSDHSERLTASDLAQSVGASASNVRKYLRLLELITPLQGLVSAGSIGLTVGNRFARLSEEQQHYVLEFIVEKGLEEVKISDCEEIIRFLEGENPSDNAGVEEKSNANEKSKFAKIEKQLQRWKEQMSEEEQELFHELLLRHVGREA